MTVNKHDLVDEFDAIEELQKFLKTDVEYNDGNSILIKINAMEKGGSKYYTPEHFNNHYINYIHYKIESDNMFTDTWNQMQIVNGLNIIYLDGDWIFSQSTEPSKFYNLSEELAEKYLKAWTKVLENNNVREYCYFIFIPEIFPEHKGGFHVFIHTKDNIRLEDRKFYYNCVKKEFAEYVEKYYSDLLVKNDTAMITKYENILYEKLFDITPIISAQSLLPFAQKSWDSRRYRLSHLSSDIIIDCKSPYLFNGIIHYQNLDMNADVKFITKTIDDDNELFNEEIENDFKQNIEKNEFSYKNLGKTGTIVAEFMESLMYLSKGHSFWKTLSNNNDRLKLIISPLIKFICANYFVETNGKQPNNTDDRFLKIITKLLIPLLKLTIHDGEITNRATYSSCFNHVKTYYERYTQVLTKFSSENGEIWENFVLKRRIINDKDINNLRKSELDTKYNNIISDEVDKLHLEYEQKKTEKINQYRDSIEMLKKIEMEFKKNKYSKHQEGELQSAKNEFIEDLMEKYERKVNIDLNKLMNKDIKAIKKENEDKKKEELKFPIAEDVIEQEKHLVNEEFIIESIKNNIRECFASWNTFVEKIIMYGIKDEIKPFGKGLDPKIPRNDTGFEDVMTPLVNDYDDLNDPAREFYVNTIRKWSMMFMYVTLYNSLSLNEAIRATIAAFARYYVWESREAAAESVLYIYNINQTSRLQSFPYNQWLADIPEKSSLAKASGINIKYWFKSMYLNFIKPELTTDYSMQRLKMMLKNTKYIVDDVLERKVRPLADFDADIDKMFNNIISSLSQERQVSPKEIMVTDSNFLPLRNGFLEFDAVTGETKFHVNNYHRYMKGFTNIIYEENYNHDNPAFKRISAMWEQIYPIPEERIYMMRLFSSVLHSGATKDQIPVLYGSGSEGKSVICNAITAMLGSEGIGKQGLLTTTLKDGTTMKITIENPLGLATSMKTEAILIPSKGGHDEGGVINLYNKRFCSVQEPNTEVSKNKFNCARLKEITSGSQIDGRNIFKGSRSFIPNCLIPIQTNTQMGYTEDTDAMRRRMSIIIHRSKFITEANKEKSKRLKYKYNADPSLNSEICNNPSYWQAIFYSLLPHAKELIREKYLPISNIPKPDSVNRSTINSFISSNALIGWFNQNILDGNGVIHIPELINKVMILHRNSTTNGILDSRKESDQRTEIIKQIEGTYLGSIYKLKSLFKGDETEISKCILSSTLPEDELINDYFDECAISNIKFSEARNYEDLYIVGYVYNEIEE